MQSISHASAYVSVSALFLVPALVLTPAPAAADTVADAFKGKTMNMYVGSAPGGGYDRYTRLIERHFNRHVPGNPRTVVKNMPGASGLKLAGYMYQAAPKDGLHVAGLHNTVVSEESMGRKVQYKSTDFNWLGSANSLTTVCIVSAGSPVKTYADAKKAPLIVGGTGSVSSSTNMVPAYLRSLTGATLQIIHGYPSTTSVILAMERGEVGGLCGLGWDSLKAQAMHLVRDKKINILVQIAKRPTEELKGVPFIMDMANSPEDVKVLEFLVARQYIGRPYAVPPGAPADRVAALRKAFLDTMADPKFLAEAEKQLIPIEVVTGEEVQKHVESMINTDKAIIARADAATLIKKGESREAKLTWRTVKGVKIDQIKKRNLVFKDGGKAVEAGTSGAKITVDGKKVKSKALKAGMTCDITYLGDHDVAGKIDCRK
ncbi:MAG: hypothetical protein GEU76_04260 [Alphaproteobacteria bacterium]|nr:hypothetical protein [Alphaproteobacteria bacterium]